MITTGTMKHKSYKYGIVIAIIIIAAGFALYKNGLIRHLPLKIRPAKPKNIFEKAEEHLRRGNYAGAYEGFRKIYHRMPNSPDGERALVQMARLSDKIDKNTTLELFAKITQNEALVKYHPEAYYSIARFLDPEDTAVPSADSEKAAEIYRKIFDNYPKSEYAARAGLRLAQLLEEQDALLEAKEIIDGLYDRKIRTSEVEEARYRQNIKILFSPIVTDQPKSAYYVIQPGDVLEKVAAKYGTTVDLIMESNDIRNPARIRGGDRIKVVVDTFHIVVSKSQNTLSLFTPQMLVKKYRVGTGKYGKTPTGSFIIKEKTKEPTWYAPGRVIPYGDPDNVLGTRWMSIEATDSEKKVSGYGIHGTWEPETVGTQCSEGCIRLVNADIEELFKIVPANTTVVKIIE